MVQNEAITGTIPILLGIGNLIAIITVNSFENPKERHYDDVKRVQKIRWGEVCSELGQAISAAYDFMEDGSRTSPEDLTDEEEASSALLQASDGPEILGDAKVRLRQVYYPKWTYQACHTTYFASFILFLLSLLIAAWAFIFSDPGSATSSTTIQVSGLVFFGGVGSSIAHLGSSFLLGRMTEELDFK